MTGDMVDTRSPTLVITGKRKRQPDLSGGSTCESDTEFSLSDGPTASSSRTKPAKPPIIVNGKLVVDGDRRYHCAFEGCSKSYRKPTRLVEHERTHTGERPFVCSTCQKTYFRDSHLQAHMRSHMPNSSRPFACAFNGCSKKFWTAQHLKRHAESHSAAKPFKCVEHGCSQSFSKHNRLRSHISLFHCPPGTKSFFCEHEGCTKSFATGQKLTAHTKTHEDHRYTCSHAACLSREEREFFPNWSALQAHTRTTHPPTCPYQSCNGKVFTQQKGLRTHLRIHEQREVEDALENAFRGDGCEADDEGENRIIKRRRGGEVGRDWKCSEDGCEKDFKSKNGLATHVKVAHLHGRDLRHLARVHYVGFHATDAPIAPKTQTGEGRNVIDILTGKAYEDKGV